VQGKHKAGITSLALGVVAVVLGGVLRGVSLPITLAIVAGIFGVVGGPFLVASRRAASRSTDTHYRGRSNWAIDGSYLRSRGTGDGTTFGRVVAGLASNARIVGHIDLTPEGCAWEPSGFWARLGFAGFTLDYKTLAGWTLVSRPGTVDIASLTLTPAAGSPLRLSVANGKRVDALLSNWWPDKRA
jgi:hypothetical protein